MAIRASMHEIGAMVLGQLLQVGPGERAARVACGRGHEASSWSIGQRDGMIPRDVELAISGTSEYRKWDAPNGPWQAEDVCACAPATAAPRAGMG